MTLIPPASSPSSRRGPTRRQLLRGGLAAAALGLGGYGVGSNLLCVERTTLARFGLRSPLRVAILSDLHAPRFWIDLDSLRDTINAARCDLVVFLGDLTESIDDLAAAAAGLAGLEARLGCFAIPGNWEVWGHIPPADLRRAWEGVGFTLLENAALPLPADGAEVLLVGLEDLLTGRPDLAFAEAERRDRPALILSHCPETAHGLAARSRGPTLVLSGHTHGGQVAPLGLAPWTPPGSGGFLSGFYQPAPTCDLYVSPGLGCSRIALRLGARPTLTLLDLT